ncbi:S-adenosyl-L-methionine-dependent methyltransferase, partial [Jimgerdemannia flammicorona]
MTFLHSNYSDTTITNIMSRRECDRCSSPESGSDDEQYRSLPVGFKSPYVSTRSASPVDDEEINRQDLQHHVFRLACHGNFSAPIEDDLQSGIRVLEVGCGSGVWILEMAHDYPHSEFIGVDAGEVYPAPCDLPSNVTFLKADAVMGLPFVDGEFDFVYQRCMMSSYTKHDWDVAVKELARVTKVGGSVEMFETELTNIERPPEDTRFWDSLYDNSKSKEIDPSYVRHMGDLLRSQNFEVEQDHIPLALGWGRPGELHAKALYMACIAFGPQVCDSLGIGMDEYVERAQEQFTQFRMYRSWHKAPYAYGKKLRPM